MKTNGWRRERSAKGTQLFFFFLCEKHSEVWVTRQLLRGVTMGSATRVWCPQRRFLFWRHGGGARNPIPTCMASVIVHIISLWQKPLQPPGTGCWPRESVLPAAWGPRSWQLHGGVEGLRVHRASWKAQVPVFLKIVGIPIDRNVGRGRKVKAVCPCICQIYQLSCGSFEQLDKMKSGALLWISNPRDRCDTHPFGQPVLSLFQAHFWFCQLYSCITMPQNQPLPWFRLRPKKQE